MAHPIATEPSPTPRALTADALCVALRALPAALLVIDAGEHVVYANARAEALLAPKHDRGLIGSRVADVLAPMRQLRDSVSAAADVDERPAITLARPGDDPQELGLQLSEIDLPGVDGRATLLLFQDISHIAKLRRERDHLLRLATVGEVLPSILHELKNPLASVTSAVELLVEEAPAGHFQADLHAVLTEVRRMKLGFEGIGIAGRALTSPRSSAVDLALRHAVQVFHTRAERDGIEIRCDVQDLPLLRLDDAVVRAIAFNLLNNSLHACRSGDSIRVSARLEEAGTTFVLQVSDSGTGMSRRTLSRCTQLFFTTKSSGSGIGLALCKSTVETAGGVLEIESEHGVGTTITMRIPLETRP